MLPKKKIYTQQHVKTILVTSAQKKKKNRSKKTWGCQGTCACFVGSMDIAFHTEGRIVLQHTVGWHMSPLCILAHTDTSRWCGSICHCFHSDTSLCSLPRKFRRHIRVGTCLKQESKMRWAKCVEQNALSKVEMSNWSSQQDLMFQLSTSSFEFCSQSES